MNTVLLGWIAVTVTGLVAAALLVLIGHAGWIATRRRRQRPLLAAARLTLGAALEGRPTDARGLHNLAGLPPTAQIGLFIEIGRSLGGIQRRRLAAVATDVGLIARAGRWCASSRWGERLRGIRLLTLLGEGEDVVPALLADRRPEVRAQAAQWVADHPEPEHVKRLLAMLDDPETLCRFTVKDSLIRLGRASAEPVLQYISDANSPPTPAALEVAAAIAEVRFLTPALQLAAVTDPRTRTLAATLLGAIGGSRATAALVELLADPHPDVRAAAAGALGRLAHWPAAPTLAASLRDPAWEVRRAAATALKTMGPAGALLLRRALTDEDRFARDMARQVLQLPAGEQPNAHHGARRLASA